MSDRVKGFVVTLERDLKDIDAEHVADAIRALRGVATVEQSITDAQDLMNRVQIRQELGTRLWEVLYPQQGGTGR